MDRLANPYRPGAGTQPEALMGRDGLIDDFGVTLRRALDGRPGKSCMPLGLRGVGKTVLLNRFMAIAEQEGARTAFMEATDSGSFSQLVAIRLRRILLQLASGPVRRVVTRALGALSSFAVHLPDGSVISVGVEAEQGVADSGVLSEDLADLLVAAGQAAHDCDTGIVLGIDEAQYLGREEMGAVIGAIDRLTPKEREYLRAMAGLGPGPHRSGDIAAELDVRVQSVAPRRSALIAKGMIYSPAHGDTAFTVPLFDDFMRRTLPPKH